MTVRAGREFLAIPGPTTMPDEVLQAMHRPALDIYSEQMLELTDSLLADLSKLFATKGKSYIYIANGHGAWEATLSNVLSRGDKLLVLESGRFGARPLPQWASRSRCSRATGAARSVRPKSRRG
jgi:alanine-glyoxylate transaminase/serine-glyoxylate transaminase/serine-pyruvate transaminase